MNFSITSTARAAFLASAMVTMSAGATTPMPVIKAQPETLPDGNVRDPEPTAEELSNLLAATKKNMVFLKGGTFDMGDWGPEVNKDGLPFDGSYDSKPLHKVTLSDFYIGKYPVTYAEFDLFTAARRSPKIKHHKAGRALDQGADRGAVASARP